ncbi:MAG: SpoIVB peptidase S55 domain-containing protein [Bacilli bacterium]
MKKYKLLIITLILLIPFNIFGYSSNIIPGGENIGISINSDGLIVVGFYKVNNKYIASSSLKVGDAILKIEGNEVSSVSSLTTLIENNIKDNKVNATIRRNNKIMNIKLELIYEDNVYKTGLYIKDRINGIGTLTYIDPITKIFGALGHEISFSETNERVEVKNGEIYSSYVNGIERSYNGTVGSKSATIHYNNKLGDIFKNSSSGIFGNYNSTLPNKGTLKVAEFNEIHIGKALAYTILSDNTIKSFNIYITGTDKKNKNSSKAISFELTDEEVINITGGVVQGMSGSPVIQDNKIIGAITHVLTGNVKTGYCIYIGTMLEEGER